MGTLAISFIGKSITALAADKNKRIISFHEIKSNFDFDDTDYENRYDNRTITETAELIQDELKDNLTGISYAGALINTSQAFLNVIPIDASEDGDNLSSHLMWDLSMYFPESYKNYSANYFKIDNPNLPPEVTEILMIAITKEKLEFIRKIFALLGLKIKIFDVDHFAAEK